MAKKRAKTETTAKAVEPVVVPVEAPVAVPEKKLTIEERMKKVENAVHYLVRWIERTMNKDINKDGIVGSAKISTLAALVCVFALALSAFASEKVFVRHVAPNGYDSVITMEADDADDDNDELQFGITAANSYFVSIGGTDVVTVDSSGNMTVAGTISGTPTAGTSATSGSSVVESYGIVNKTTFTFAKTLTATDGSAEGETHKLYTFPEGRIYILGGALDATIVNTASAANANDIFLVGIGTAAANDDADLSDANETDIFAGPTLEDAAVTLTNQWEVDFTAGGDSVFDGTSTAATLNLNMGIADACITTNHFSAAFSGGGTVFWINLGDD